MNIGFSVAYSRQFLAVPNMGFNILQPSLVSPNGRKFIQELRANHRQVYSWTVSSEKNMDWCIRQGLDGIVTDNVPKFLGMCETFQEERKYPWPLKLLLGFTYINIWLYLFSVVFRKRYGTCVEKETKTDKTK